MGGGIGRCDSEGEEWERRRVGKREAIEERREAGEKAGIWREGKKGTIRYPYGISYNL